MDISKCQNCDYTVPSGEAFQFAMETHKLHCPPVAPPQPPSSTWSHIPPCTYPTENYPAPPTNIVQYHGGTFNIVHNYHQDTEDVVRSSQHCDPDLLPDIDASLCTDRHCQQLSEFGTTIDPGSGCEGTGGWFGEDSHSWYRTSPHNKLRMSAQSGDKPKESVDEVDGTAATLAKVVHIDKDDTKKNDDAKTQQKTEPVADAKTKVDKPVENAAKEAPKESKKAKDDGNEGGEEAESVPEVDKAALREAFVLFSKFGERTSDGKTIKLSQSDKWFKQAKVIEGKKITTTDTGIAFRKIAKNTPKLSFGDWIKYLDEIAKNKKINVNVIKNKLVDCGKPGLSGATKVAKSAAVDRLTDASKYGGTHGNRFDKEGKGKGKEGRVDPKSDGYVSGYKNKGASDKPK